MVYRCKVEACGKVFVIPAKLMVEKKPADFTVVRLVTEKPCCPFCEGLEFEEAP